MGHRKPQSIEQTSTQKTASIEDVPVLFDGVSSLHQSFFSNSKARKQLTKGLDICGGKDRFVRVGFDTERRIGTIEYVFSGSLGKCSVVEAEGHFLLDSLAPIGSTLATYRDQISAQYDYRISSFRIGLTGVGGAEACTLWAVGPNPPDGHTWGKCVDVGDQPVCAFSPELQGFQRLPIDEDVLGRFRQCFMSGPS